MWPDHPQRLARLRAAIEVARRAPPELVVSDLRHALPDLLAGLPAEMTCCLFHSAALNQLQPAERDEVDRQLLAASSDRQIHRVAAEFEQLTWHLYAGGRTHTQRVLASFDPHGRWLRWNAG